MRAAWPGPLKKSGSPNVMCSAPAATCRRMSSSTTSGCTTRKTPRYTGTTGQWRHRCLQPRRSLGVAHRPRTADRHQVRVSSQRREAGPVRHQKLLPLERDAGAAAALAARGGRQRLLELAADDRIDSGAAQHGLVERGIQPVRAEVGPRIRGLHAVQHPQEQARGGVHGQVERDQVGLLDGGGAGSGLQARSATVTWWPSARSHAAGDASPKGCRPSS